MHDWSKFSPTEFWESVKYFDGHKSPITVCKVDKGYSEAWLHHKGRNKHHYQYWTDLSLPEQAIMMPYKYAAEMDKKPIYTVLRRSVPKIRDGVYEYSREVLGE